MKNLAGWGRQKKIGMTANTIHIDNLRSLIYKIYIFLTNAYFLIHFMYHLSVKLTFMSLLLETWFSSIYCKFLVTMLIIFIGCKHRSKYIYTAFRSATYSLVF